MTTIDNLNGATANLSLGTNTLTAPFTLFSGDGHLFPQDSALPLAGASGVISGMLEGGSGERFCDLSETKEEVEDFLSAVKEGNCRAEHAWKLIEMADKYEAPVLLTAAGRAAWDMLSDDPWSVFAIGCKLGDKCMMQVAAEKSLSLRFKDGLSPSFDSLDKEDKDRLMHYRQAVVETARRCIKLKFPRMTCSHDGISESAFTIWSRARRAALQRLALPMEPDDVMREDIRRLNSRRADCAKCSIALEGAVQKVRVAWRAEKGGWKSVKLEFA